MNSENETNKVIHDLTTYKQDEWSNFSLCHKKGEQFSTPLDKDGHTKWSWHTARAANDHKFLDEKGTGLT